MSNLDGKISVKPHIRVMRGAKWVPSGYWLCSLLGNPRAGWGRTPSDAYYSWKAS